MFQSTRPHGTRLSIGSRLIRWLLVSIHASAWDATSGPRPRPAPSHRFNPRVRMGRDTGDTYLLPTRQSFNPRVRMGRDRSSCSDRSHVRLFQSTRPHGTRREHHEHDTRRRTVSIHASAWDATRRWSQPTVLWSVSIHASAWDATCVTKACASGTAGFNPRVRMGRDGQPPLLWPPDYGFNPRVRMGRDCQFPCSSSVVAGFNPRVRMGRDIGT